MIGRPLAIGVLLAAVLAAAGCATPDLRPDVVVITIDTLRADRLGSFGNGDALTPTLDALAARGVRFADASAATPVTLPSHATLFTGRYPTATGVRNNGTFVVPPDEITLAERLRDAGWRTAAVVAAYPLDERYGLAQGFDVYDDDLPAVGAADGGVAVFFPERAADQVTDRAIAAWRALGEDAPRLLWVHYFDPHAPYAPPGEWGERFADRRYDGEVAFADAEIGRLLTAIDPDGRALVVAASDHGEGLGEHGEKTHGVFLYQTTMHVPLLIAAPGRWPEGRTVDEPVSLADVAPTVLGLLDLDPLADADGVDLGPAVVRRETPTRPVYGESFVPRFDFRFSELRMIRDGALKYIDAPAPELYDLSQDPEETRDLAGGHPDEPDLRDRLHALALAEDPGAAERAAGLLDEEAMATLRSLGYVASGGPAVAAGEGRGRDPKTMTRWIREHDRAMGLLSAGRTDDGIAALRALASEAPENWLVPFQIATGLVDAGRLDEAEATLKGILARAPEFSHGHLLLAEVRARLGLYDRAADDFRAAAATLPWSAEPWFRMGSMYAGAGRFDDAAAAWIEAIGREPSAANYVRALIDLRASRGEPARAASDLAALAARRPPAPEVLAGVARAHRLAGDLAAARSAIAAAEAADATRASVRLEAGEIALASGDPAGAGARFEAAVAADPASTAARFGLARSLAASGRELEADAQFAALFRLDPGFAPALVFQGGRAERRGDRKAAAELYRHALSADPGSREAWEGLRRTGARR